MRIIGIDTMKVIVTSPSLDTTQNVSGISSVTNFITKFNNQVQYIHFELGKKDNEVRNFLWLFRIVKSYFSWFYLLFSNLHAVIHFNLAVDKRGVLRDAPLLLLAKVVKRRMIVHLHGGEYLSHKHPPKWMLVILRMLFSGKSPIIVLSTKEAEIVKSRFRCRNVFVLPNCIDLTDARKFCRVQQDGKLKILFIGRISTAKGIEFIYQALKNLKSQGVAFEFSLAGKGPDEQEYVGKFTRSLGDDFKFKGVVEGRQKVELLQNNSVFLLPSFFEGLPISLLECMAFGLIPIATPVGSIADIIRHGENGFLVRVKSVQEIESVIKQLNENFHIMPKLSENAKQFIFQNYDPEQYIGRLSKIYCNE